MNKIISILMVVLLMGTILSGCSNLENLNNGNNVVASGSLKKFSSEDEINTFLETNSNTQYSYYSRNSVGLKSSTVADIAVAESVDFDGAVPTVSGSGSDEYSTTNVQIEGVDEADIVKNDGEFIYYVSNNIIYIVKANPAKDMEILSKIKFDDAYISEIYVNENKLIVLGSETFKTDSEVEKDSVADIAVSSKMISSRIMPYPYYYRNNAFAAVYDISDKEEPKREEKISLEGNYFNSRMIGDYVYIIFNKGMYRFISPIIYYGDGLKKTIEASSVSYFDMPDSSYELSIIMSLNLKDNSFSEKSILKGYSQNVFVSEDNIYLINQKYVPYYYEEKRIIEEVVMDLVPSNIKSKIEKVNSYDLREETKLSEIQFILQDYSESLTDDERVQLEKDAEKETEKIRREIQSEREKTIINRISIDSGKIEHEAKGEVPGYVLNQFSMDEFDGYFRIATTTGNSWSSDENRQKNHVYVLDMDMKVVGKLEDLAPDERIYSVRYMGKRAYMVTFRNVDPLFVIDLSDAKNPNVLGKLKIPGFSNYLHPYDENHIIGIGKETEEDSENKDVVRMGGLKMSLFDVSDVENPIEISKVEIGDRGTDSDALYNHKAFLFSRNKDLLVLPIRVAEIDEDKYKKEDLKWAYGDFVFQGVYVYNLTVENGFDLKGKVTHVSDESLEKSGYYYYSDESILRSLYIGDTLYTLSNAKIGANSLSNLKEISSVELDKLEVPEYEPYYAREVDSVIME